MDRQGHRAAAPHSQRICLRGDTAYSLTENFDRWAESIDFVLGMSCNAKIQACAEALPEEAWSRLERKPSYETLTDESRTRYQRNEKERIVVRIIGCQPTLDRLFSAWNAIERTSFG